MGEKIGCRNFISLDNFATPYLKCGRWDLNPHDCNSHKILSLARLPVPTLPQSLSYRLSEKYNTIVEGECQAEIVKYCFLSFVHIRKMYEDGNYQTD